MEQNKKAVYRFSKYFRRSGTLSGVFISTKEQVRRLIDTNITVYFGEVLGKHSDIFSEINQEDILLISDDPEIVSMLEKHPDIIQGINPLTYSSLNFDFDKVDLSQIELNTPPYYLELISKKSFEDLPVDIILRNLIEKPVNTEYIKCVDRFDNEIKEGDFVDVQTDGVHQVYKKEDGQLYFKPYGKEDRVCDYLSNDLIISN